MSRGQGMTGEGVRQRDRGGGGDQDEGRDGMSRGQGVTGEGGR